MAASGLEGLCACWRYGAVARTCNATLGLALPLMALLLTLMTGASRAATDDGAGPLRLLVLGDSLTAGYGLAQDEGFVPRLEAALRADGYDVRVMNGGVSGDTSAGGLARLPWLLDAPAADWPDAVMVELGGNDGLRGVDPKAMERNLDETLRILAARDLPVLLTGMKAPPNLGADYGRAFEAVFVRLAEKHGVPLYPFFLEGVAAVPALNQPDGIHPNARGVTDIVRRILPATKAFLDTVAVGDAVGR